MTVVHHQMIVTLLLKAYRKACVLKHLTNCLLQSLTIARHHVTWPDSDAKAIMPGLHTSAPLVSLNEHINTDDAHLECIGSILIACGLLPDIGFASISH